MRNTLKVSYQLHTTNIRIMKTHNKKSYEICNQKTANTVMANKKKTA